MENFLEKPFLKSLSRNKDVYIVGGAVRDALLGKNDIKEIDLVVDNFESIKEIVSGKHFIELSEKFGTLRVFTDGIAYDITPMSGKIEDDLIRRDFTINSIAYHLSSKSFVDPLGGVDDLKKKELKLSSRLSFCDDPIRILRAARFGPGLGFEVNEVVYLELEKNLPKLNNSPLERIGQEFLKLCVCDNPSKAITWLHDYGILSLLIPEWRNTVGFLQNEFHTEDVANHTLTVIRRMEDLLRNDNTLSESYKQILILSALFHDIMKPASFSLDKTGRRRFYNHEYLGAIVAERVLKSWAIPSQVVSGVKLLVRLHMRPITCGSSGARRILRETGDLFKLWRLLKIADKPPIQPDDEFFAELNSFDELVKGLTPTQMKKFSFNGKTLISLGIMEGPRLGSILKSLKMKALEKPEYDSESFVRDIVSRFRKG